MNDIPERNRRTPEGVCSERCWQSSDCPYCNDIDVMYGDLVAERSRQYKELSVSKNRQVEPFRLFVRRKGDKTYFCAMEGNPDYLCERGDEWKRLGIATHYYVSNIRQPFQ